MSFQLTTSGIVYLIVALVVIALGLYIAGMANLFSMGETKKMQKLFAHELVHPMEGPTKDFIEIDCEVEGENFVPQKITLKDMSFEYIGNEKLIKFIILLDWGDKIIEGYYIGYPESQEVECKLGEDKIMQCDPERDYYFDISGIQPIYRTRDYFHFTIWRSDILTHLRGLSEESQTLTNLLEHYSKYYLASFGIGGIVTDEMCRSFMCKQKYEVECKLSPDCYWKSGLWVKNECKVCPLVSDKTKCREYEKDACEQCSFAKTNCEWFENYCEKKQYVAAENKCRTCQSGGCNRDKCHTLSTPYSAPTPTSIGTDEYTCSFNSGNKACHLCPENANCGTFLKEDCIEEASRCNPNLKCKVDIYNKCVPEVV